MSIADLKSIREQPLSIKAADAIRDGIITGVFTPGQKITEDEVATSLGLSKIVVREAFARLQDEGLLMKNVNRSTTVAVFSKDDVNEIYLVRLSLEKLCIEMCCERQTTPFSTLEKIISNMEKLSKKKNPEPMDLLRSDFDFHEAIVEAAGSPRISRMWQQIKGQSLAVLYPVQKEFISTHNKGFNVIYHKDLFKALKSGDMRFALATLENHIINSKETLLNLYDD